MGNQSHIENRGESVGTVKFFNEEKGFGFIVVQGAEDVFFHINQVMGGYQPAGGDRVKFDVIHDHRRKRTYADGVILGL